MRGYLQELVGFVSLHAVLAYIAVFFAALLEAVPILGSLIPGSTIILALGALVPGGTLQLAPLLAAAMAGAVIGDGTAYCIGRRRQREILGVWPLSNYPAIVAQSEDFFHRYGTFAVLFARFIPPIRAIVPLTAGALDMPPRRFFTVMPVAVLLWAPAHVLPGVLAGAAAERWGARVEHYGLPLVGGIIAAGCVLLAAQHWYSRRRAAGARQVHRG